MLSFALDVKKTIFWKSENIGVKRQENIPIRGISFYKQSLFAEQCQKELFLQNMSLSVGFFDYYIEKTSTHCKKVDYSGIFVLGRTKCYRKFINTLSQNSCRCDISSGEKIVYSSLKSQKSILANSFFISMEIAEKFDDDFKDFVIRAADILEAQNVIISVKRNIIIDFFSNNDISWGKVEKMFQLFPVKRCIYISFN